MSDCFRFVLKVIVTGPRVPSDLFVETWRFPYLGTTAIEAHRMKRWRKKSLEPHYLITNIQKKRTFHYAINKNRTKYE